MFSYSGAIGVLGALRKRSLKEEDLFTIEKKSLKASIEHLKFYFPLQTSSLKTLSEVEHLLNLGFIERITKLLRFLKNEAFLVLRSLLFEYDIFNIKLLSRSVHSSLPLERIEKFFYLWSPFLAFRALPQNIKTYQDIERLLRRSFFLKKMFAKALNAFSYHKDIFYFEVSLDMEFLNFLKEISKNLTERGKIILENYMRVNSLIWILRFKFFQNREKTEIYNFFSSVLEKEVLFKILKTDSLFKALEVIENFVKFSLSETEDFEEGLKQYLFSKFLRKREVRIFSSAPFLIYALKQKYILERIIFTLNKKEISYV